MSTRSCIAGYVLLSGVGCGGAADPAVPRVSDAGSVVADHPMETADIADVTSVAVDAGTSDPFHDPINATPVTGAGAITLSGGAEGGWVDGPRASALFRNPTNVLLGPDGNVYVADYDNGDVRLVRPNGVTLTFTRQDAFSHPFGMAFAPDGTLYVQTDDDDTALGLADAGTIWRLDRRTGVATVVVRDIGRPRGLAALSDGRLVLVDIAHDVVRLLDPTTRAITDLAGSRDVPGFADGTGAAARFDHPNDVVVGPGGLLIVADRDNNRLRSVSLAGVVSTYAGTGVAGSLDGPSGTATFNLPQGLAADTAGNVFVTDTGAYVVRRIAPNGAVTTVAGDGTAGFADGAPMQARFFGLEGLDVSADGSSLYVADGNRGGTAPNPRVRRFESPIETHGSHSTRAFDRSLPGRIHHHETLPFSPAFRRDPLRSGRVRSQYRHVGPVGRGIHR